MKASQTAPFGTDHTPPIQTKIIGSKQVDFIDYDSINKANQKADLTALSSPPLLKKNLKQDNSNTYQKNLARTGINLSPAGSEHFLSPPTKRQQAILNEIKDQNQSQNTKVSPQQTLSSDLATGITSKATAYCDDGTKDYFNQGSPTLKKSTLDTLDKLTSPTLDKSNDSKLLFNDRTLNELKLSRSLPLNLSIANNNEEEKSGRHGHTRASTDHRVFGKNRDSPNLTNQSPLLDQGMPNLMQNEKAIRNILPPIAISDDQLGKKFHQQLQNFDRSKYKYIYNTIAMMDKGSTNCISRDELMEICRLYQIPIKDDELNQLFTYFQDPQNPKYAYYAEILKFMNAAQEGDFQNTRLTSHPSPSIGKKHHEDQALSNQESKTFSLFHDRQDAKLIQSLQKEFLSSKTQIELKGLIQAFQEINNSNISINMVKEICNRHHLPLSDSILNALIERCQNEDQGFNSSAFLLFLERAQPFPLLDSPNRVKDITNIKSLASQGIGKPMLENKFSSSSNQDMPDYVKNDQIRWQKDVLVKLDSISKEQEETLNISKYIL
ncbi:uncharacterized protein TRIADDRAFT_59412 [Trichoplax adhaerens]|uniref:EF-hand domain-containing protein n=1 Tax=Trichoplax adhaerens TaxID=10228 RepID=B3S502_TRIAD|nr:predicted protein [Trichoplax adhaerens]EDV22180.1 predicted protein [Trichoplax adhaerens]|eukprot:XP_002115335.1 predicted protein [Trichoplax adhaerens]